MFAIQVMKVMADRLRRLDLFVAKVPFGAIKGLVRIRLVFCPTSRAGQHG